MTKRLPPIIASTNLDLACLVRKIRVGVPMDNLAAARAQARIQLDQLRKQLADEEAP